MANQDHCRKSTKKKFHRQSGVSTVEFVIGAVGVALVAALPVSHVGLNSAESMKSAANDAGGSVTSTAEECHMVFGDDDSMWDPNGEDCGK